MTQCPLSVAGFNATQADQQVRFNLLAHGIGENKPANPRGAHGRLSPGSTALAPPRAASWWP